MFQVVENNSRIDIRETGVTHHKLQVGVYVVEYDDIYGIFHLVKKSEKFKIPSKIYGDHSIVNRWIKSHEHNTGKNLGILLSGLKGTGKTITAEIFCNKIQKPVIMFTKGWSGPKFLNFITNPVFHDTVLFIDEFEKVYNNDKDTEAQDGILSLMDGLYDTRFVFLLTVNKDNISEYLINRLGRIKYYKKYENLEKNVIDEVVEDLLINKELAPSIDLFQNEYNICTFDILVNLIKEMNLFNEDAMMCAKHLLLVGEQALWSVHQILNDEIFVCDNVKLSKVTNEMGVIVTRGSDVIKKLKVLNDEIIRYNTANKDNDEIDYRTTYDTNIRLNLTSHEIIVEEESRNVFKVTYTPYNDPGEYPSQVFIFEKQKFYYY